MEKIQSIIELKDLEETGQITIISNPRTTWRVWIESTRKYREGFIERGVWKEWIERRPVEIKPITSASKYKILEVELNPAQKINNYNRASKSSITSMVKTAELKITEKNYLEILKALCEKIERDNLSTIAIKDFSFGYTIQEVNKGEISYKTFTEIIPLYIENGVATNQKKDILSML